MTVLYKTQILNEDTKYSPDGGTGHIDATSAGAFTAALTTVAVGDVWTVDVYLTVTPSGPAVGTVSGWKLTGAFVGTAGPTAALSGTVSANAYGGGTAILTTIPTLIVSGSSILLQFTNPDATVRRVGYEFRIARMVF